MANVFTRFVLFLSSYIPLWVIFAVVTWEEKRMLAIGFGAAAVLSFIGTVLYLRLAQRLAGIDLMVGVIRRKDSDTMSYIASYIIPFAATPFDKIDQTIALVIFLAVLCAVYVNSSMIHVNPLLSLMGYRLYEIEDADGNPYFLISKANLRRGETVRGIDLANNIFLEKRP